MKKSDLNVLIIDDDKSMASAISEAIKRKGYRPVCVSKPEEAENLIKIKPVHAIVCDVMLPGRNGIDLVNKLKENLSDEIPIVFVSGIYKDKTFIADAIKNTDVSDYLTKPFDISKLVDIFDKKLGEILEEPTISLHSLLSANITSSRDRRKAVERVESMCGFDLPFLISILMDSKSSGHLNLVDEDHNIYGITFAEGTVGKFDSETSKLYTRKLLIQHGFISESDLGEIQNKSSDIVKSLVDEGLMSPHVPEIVKGETILTELKKLLPAQSIRVNFVPDKKLKMEPGNLDSQGFIYILHDILMHMTPVAWLKKFYAVWMGHPIRLGPQFSDFHLYAALPMFNQANGIIEFFKKEATLEEIFSLCPHFTEDIIYKSLHFLMLRRALVFEDSKRVKNLDEHVGRLKTMWEDLRHKNPLQIFAYFGLQEGAKAADLSRVYKEFARSHHPDILTKHVNDEIRKTNHDLFARVTSAYETLSNVDKKEKFINELKQQEAERQIKSDELVGNAANLLNKGKYADAFPLAKLALETYESEQSTLHFWWARFKIDDVKTTEDLRIIDKKHRSMSPGIRKSALWLFLKGLIKRNSGDLGGAEADFLKTLELDENFMDARRELTHIKARRNARGSGDAIHEISSVIKGIFKKKGA